MPDATGWKPALPGFNCIDPAQMTWAVGACFDRDWASDKSSRTRCVYYLGQA